MIAEKQSLRAALAAAICAFGVSFGAVFCPVSAFGLPVDSWALLLVCLAASIVFSVIFAVFRPVYGFGAEYLCAPSIYQNEGVYEYEQRNLLR